MANPKAQAFKEKGNQAFKTGDYPTAIGHYTSAILADRADPTFPLNRAAAYLKLGKNEDAERDCTTVLDLSKNNVKALFRRGQARVGMGMLLEAQKDFTDVLLIEPSNTAAQDELKNVAALIKKEKAKKSKAPISPVQSSLEPQAVAAKRRRVPIRIVEPSGASAQSESASVPSAPGTSALAPPAPPKPTTQPQPQPPKPKSSSPATLEPVSTRSLKSPSPSPAPVPAPASVPPPPAAQPRSPAPAPSTNGPASASSSAPAFSTTYAVPAPGHSHPQPVTQSQSQQQPKSASASPTPEPTPTTTPTTPNTKPSKPESFKDAKQARQSKSKSKSNTRVGGGIFRASGESTVFPVRGEEEEEEAGAEAVQVEVPVEVEVNGDGDGGPAHIRTRTRKQMDGLLPATATASPAPPTPKTYFEFARTWDALRTPEERWQLLNTIPPTHFPALCKTSLEPTMLVSMLDVFRYILDCSSSASSSSSPSFSPSSANSEALNPQSQTPPQAKISAYLDHFAHIPRFSTLVLFLSKQEKEGARAVWAALGVERSVLQEGEGVWNGIC